MIYIFDLDYTLLDCAKLKDDLAKIFVVEKKVFDNTYKKYFTDRGEFYNFSRHLEYLGVENNKNIKLEFNKYLFPQIEQVLKKLKNNGHKLILFTYGDLEWQKLKVDNLKIKVYFDTIVYTDKLKGDYISENMEYLYKGENVVIVNDNAKECVDMKRVLPYAEVIMIKSKYSDNMEHKFKIVATLEDLKYN